MTELRESMGEFQTQARSLSHQSLELSQVDTQRLDQGLSDLQENIFRNGVAIDRCFEECKRQIAQGLPSSSRQVSLEAYQEHARGTETAMEQCQSQIVAQERRFMMEKHTYIVFKEK